jgi:hypothetical protein
MAKVKIQGNASGTGTLTLTAPNTNADRTITLPDGTGELLAKDSSGNLGIGTTSPLAKLHIAAGFNPDGVTTTPAIATSGSYGGAISLFDTKESGMYTQANGTELRLYTGRLNGTNTAASKIVMTLKDGGKVGIGTTSPSGKLDIKGNFESSYALKFTNTMGTGKVSGFRSHGTNGENLSLYHDGRRMQMWQSDGTHIFESTVGSERMRIDSAGRVTMPYQPCFAARGMNANTSYGVSAKFDLTSDTCNSPDYNTSTSTFTAPVTGNYYFGYGVYSYVIAQFTIKVNGSDYRPANADTIGLFSTATTNSLENASLVVPLATGDYVTFGFRSGYSGNIYGQHTWFSGHLIG